MLRSNSLTLSHLLTLSPGHKMIALYPFIGDSRTAWPLRIRHKRTDRAPFQSGVMIGMLCGGKDLN
jgi:hypothetical protein